MTSLTFALAVLQSLFIVILPFQELCPKSNLNSGNGPFWTDLDLMESKIDSNSTETESTFVRDYVSAASSS